MAKKPAKKSIKKPAAKKAAAKKSAAKPVKKTSTAKPAAKKPAKAAAAKTPAKGKVAAKKAAPQQKAKATPPPKSPAKTAAKVAGGLAVAGVALSVARVASKATTDVTKVFSPLDDRIIVEETKTELRTPGGLFIPDTVATPDGPREGRVLAVGRGHMTKKGKMRPLDVKLGDTVLFETYLGSPLKIGDREVIVLRESQLLGIVSP